MTITNQQIVSLLENVLFESATQAAANAATWAANPAAGSIASLASAMAGSGEEKIAATVVGYYLASLGRAPNAAEIRYYVAIAEQGLSQTQIAAGQVASSTWDTIGKYFANSPEFATRGSLDYSIGNTAAYFEAVPWLYQSVLGRAPNSAEVAYYDNQVLQGTDLGTLFREFTASREFHANTDAQIAAALDSYGATVASGTTPPPAVAIGVTVTPSSAPTPVPAPAPAPAVFTTSTDTLTSTDTHTYTATLGTGATLTANDSLHGAGNTLAISDHSSATTQDVLPTGLSLTGVPTITLTTDGNAGTDAAHPFDLSGFASVTSFTLDSSGTAHGDFIKIGGGVAVSVAEQGASLTIDLPAAGIGSLALSGTNGGVTLVDPAGPTSLTIDVSGGLTVTGGIADSSNRLTALTLDGSTSAPSTIDALSGSALTHITLSDGVTLGTDGTHLLALGANVTTLSGSADNAANFIATTAAGASITLGNGNNTVKDNGGGATIALGTGDNIIDLASHGNSTVIANTDANYTADSLAGTANVVIKNAAAGDVLLFAQFLGGANAYTFGSTITTNNPVAELESQLSGTISGSHSSVIEGRGLDNNIYIVASDDATLAGPTHTVIVEIIGNHNFTLTGNNLELIS